MNVPDVRNDERLGRRVTSRKLFKKIQNNINKKESSHPCPRQVFKPKSGEAEISVDRLDLASIKEMAAIANRIAGQGGKACYGWGVVVYRSIIPDGFTAHASPDQDSANDYHADLRFPYQIADRVAQKDKRKDWTLHLAERAAWLPCPEIEAPDALPAS